MTTLSQWKLSQWSVLIDGIGLLLCMCPRGALDTKASSLPQIVKNCVKSGLIGLFLDIFNHSTLCKHSKHHSEKMILSMLVCTLHSVPCKVFELGQILQNLVSSGTKMIIRRLKIGSINWKKASFVGIFTRSVEPIFKNAGPVL